MSPTSRRPYRTGLLALLVPCLLAAGPTTDGPPGAEGSAQATDDAPPASEDAPPATEEVPRAEDNALPAADDALPADEAPPDAEVERDPSAPVLGLADLHLHQWAESGHGGRWYHGSATGTEVLEQCQWIGRDGDLRQAVKHGQLAGEERSYLLRLATKWGFRDERSDDVRGRHPPGGLSVSGELPHWLGWPTSDTLAHQQVWEGWLRLAHDGLPAAWFVRRWLSEYPDGDIHDALDAFYARHLDNVRDAADAGVAGLNLAVVSLVNANTSCRSLVGVDEQEDFPQLCNDMDVVYRQYVEAVAWAEANSDWAEIVTSPEEARRVIHEGRLAIVLHIETSDLFGPSDLIEVDGEKVFANGYYTPTRGEVPDDEPSWVRERLSTYLDVFPEVTSLQLTHQVDNPFGGSALVNTSLVWTQRSREKKVGECAKAATFAWKYGETDDAEASPEYVGCWEGAAGKPGGANAFDGIRRLVVWSYPAPYALPRWYRKRGKPDGRPSGPFAEDNVYRNAYGLSPHGRILVDLMVERGMPIDVSHLSTAGVTALSEHLKAQDAESPHPLYFSHAYPFEWSLTSREQNPSASTVALVAETHGGMIGMRPGDDEVNLTRQPAEGELSTDAFHRTLDTYDCQRTSVAAGVYLTSFLGSGAPVAFGSDLNGYINQPGPTGQLEPYTWRDRPCTVAVPSVGSEVGTRGLAHVGLLPQLYVEMLHTAREPEAVAAVQHLQHGAEAYLRMWERARGGVVSQSEPAASEPAASEPAASELARSEAPTPATPETWTDLLREGGDLRRVDVATEEGEVSLPLLRAVEGTLPYRHLGDGTYPQLAVNIGFLLGLHRYGIYPERYHYPVRRCKHAGIVRSRGRGAAGCRELRKARHEFQKNFVWNSSLSRWTPPGYALRQWDRTYPGPVRRGIGTPFVDLLEETREPDHGQTVALADHESFEAVRDWVLQEENRSCLVEERFLLAPAPGIPSQRDPMDYLQRAPWKGGGFSDPGMACYCELLVHLDDNAPMKLAAERSVEFERASAVCRAGLRPDAE